MRPWEWRKKSVQKRIRIMMRLVLRIQTKNFLQRMELKSQTDLMWMLECSIQKEMQRQL